MTHGNTPDPRQRQINLLKQLCNEATHTLATLESCHDVPVGTDRSNVFCDPFQDELADFQALLARYQELSK